MTPGINMRTRPIQFTTKTKLGTPLKTFCRKFTYKADAQTYKKEVAEWSEWSFFTKKGGFWTVVYARCVPYTVGDQPAIEGVDY